MPQTIFSDGIADIVVTAGLVRIEFFTLVRDSNVAGTEGGPPPMQPIREHVIVLPLPAFVGAMKLLDEVFQKLVADRVIEPRSNRPSPAVANPPRKSPNFG